MKDRLVLAIERIRPALQAEGGDVRFVSVQDGVVRVRLEGACDGCPRATVTLKLAIEASLREEFPEIQSVEATNLTQTIEEYWKAISPRPAPVAPPVIASRENGRRRKAG